MAAYDDDKNKRVSRSCVLENINQNKKEKIKTNTCHSSWQMCKFKLCDISVSFDVVRQNKFERNSQWIINFQ